MTNRTTFQLRVTEGTWRVFLVRTDGREVPADRQYPVFSDKSMSRAQTVCDALNRGMLVAIGSAMRKAAER